MASQDATVFGVDLAVPFEAQEDKSLLAATATATEPVQILNRLRLLLVSQRAGQVEIDLLVQESERGEPSLHVSEV